MYDYLLLHVIAHPQSVTDSQFASANASLYILSGEGAYGKVWMGLDLSTGNMMAVKELQLVGRRGSKEVENQLKELTQV